MRVSTQFPIAVHAMMILAKWSGEKRVTSDDIARSAGCNAVIIRNIFGKLKRAELIAVAAGKGGTTLAKEPENITLWDIYSAVETEETNEIFKFHMSPSATCPVGNNIYGLLISHLDDAVAAMKKELAATTLSDLCRELNVMLVQDKCQ